MNSFEVEFDTAIPSRKGVPAICVVCKKAYKVGYKNSCFVSNWKSFGDTYLFPEEKHAWVCSERCANFFILQNI